MGVQTYSCPGLYETAASRDTSNVKFPTSDLGGDDEQRSA